MFAPQGAELMVIALLWVVPVVALYWIIRLAVRHGTLDAYRIDRTDQRIASMKASIRSGRVTGAPDERP